jgi:hypothetical protein
MQTKVSRIDLTNIPAPTAEDPSPLATLINNATVKAGLPLVSTFVYQTDLLLVFQKAN